MSKNDRKSFWKSDPEPATNPNSEYNPPLILNVDQKTETFSDGTDEVVNNLHPNEEKSEETPDTGKRESHDEVPETSAETKIIMEHAKPLIPPEIMPNAYLIVKTPVEARGDCYRIKGLQKITVGRGKQCDPRLNDNSVSDSHADFEIRGIDEHGGVNFIVYDLNSGNGTYINGSSERLNGLHRLQDGDEVRIGSFLFVCKLLVD